MENIHWNNLVSDAVYVAAADILWFCNRRSRVHQLTEEDDRCELRCHDDTFSLTVFDARKSDGLEYMCIVVNEIGQCAQGFSVTVEGEFAWATVGRSWATVGRRACVGDGRGTGERGRRDGRGTGVRVSCHEADRVRLSV